MFPFLPPHPADLPAVRSRSFATFLATAAIPAILAIAALSPARAALPAGSGSGDPGPGLDSGPSALAHTGLPIRERARGTFASLPAGSPWIHLGGGYSFDPAATDPVAALPADLRALAPVPGRRDYFVVQFDGPIEAEDHALLGAHAATVVRYLPDYAFLVGADPTAAEALAGAHGVSWVGQFQPAWKLSTQAEMSLPGVRDLVVLLFPGEDMGSATAAIEATGAQVLETSANGINAIVRVALDPVAAPALARIPAVAWVEPHHVPQVRNDQCQWVVQTNQNGNRHVWNQNIRGQNQVVNVVDTGVRVTHNQFRDAAVPLTTFGDYPTHRKVIAYQRNTATANIVFGDESLNGYHGTHTAGTTAGNDAPHGSDLRDGMALEAKIYFNDGGGGPDPGILIPLDLNDLYIMSYTGNAGGAARISTNSWGNDTGGAYDIQCLTADQFMWSHPDYLICYANGNAGPGTNTVGSPASAKNTLSVGGTGNGTGSGSIYNSTSRGPTDDNRRKPTLCAPATLTSALGSGDTGYTSSSGTSMATPAAAGATTLLRQYLVDGWYPTGAATPGNGFVPSAALLKAMAVNSADANVGSFTIPDNNIGWGRIDIDNVLPFGDDSSPQRRLALVDENGGLLTSEYVEYEVYVAASTLPLEATLVWTDAPGNPGAAVQLVNDLDFIATDPSGIVYRGNVYSGGQSTTGGSADSRNVEECVQRNTPTTGVWTFRIEARNVPVGPQPFALVVTGALGSDQGLVALDRPVYAGEDVAHIRIVDTNAGPSVTVEVSSDTDAAESVVLTGANGVYEGSIPLALTFAQSGDGVLQVSDGDVVLVSYDDANPVTTLTATALVNHSGPAISDVHASVVNEADVTIAWTTSTPANSRVVYGTTPALGLSTPLDPALGTGHAVVLSGLLPSTTYYYDVESYDAQGNGVRDDNGGLHYVVSTDANRDVLLVLGDASFDKKQYYVNALERHGWTYTIWEGAQAATPYVGDLTSGMASYKAVIWQTGLEQYPVINDAARDSLSRLNDLGSRIALYSHDLVWDFCDPGSPDDTPARKAFVEEEFKVTFQDDPLSISSARGYSGDPISGSYTGGISYTPHRDGAACDEIDGISTGGTVANVWRNNDSSVDDIAVRWTSSTNDGVPGAAVWGGTPRKVSTNCFEWAHLNVGNADDVTRAAVLDKTLIWLIGHDHPTATVTGPNGGETVTGTTLSIAWTEAVDGGYAIASRKLYYSDNQGGSWNLITASPGTSPYLWDVSALPNGAQYRVKIVVGDNATPALSASDTSNGDFTLARPGGDTRGPVVLAGSVATNPNPVRAADAATLTATVSDVYAGNGGVAAAEWSMGMLPAAPGSGVAMGGAFGTPEVDVAAVIPAETLAPGTAILWVRGQDASGNWGNATSLEVLVNSAADVADGRIPLSFALHANAPNPFAPETYIRFDVPRSAHVRLVVFDAGGRLVRTLVDATVTPGVHLADWNARDGRGQAVPSGVYFYRLETAGFADTRKLTVLR